MTSICFDKYIDVVLTKLRKQMNWQSFDSFLMSV